VKNTNEKHIIAMMLIRQRFRDVFHLRNTKGDRVLITDQITVKNGNKIVVATKGHIVNQGLINLVNQLSYLQGSATGVVNLWGYAANSWSSKSSYMRVGTGAGATAYNTSSLTTIVNTAADSQSGTTTNPSNGVFKLNLNATWNAGTLAAITVSEIGLFCGRIGNQQTLQAFAWNPNSSTHTIDLFSRISEADGDFEAFVVNIAVPLTITWTLTFSFA